MRRVAFVAAAVAALVVASLRPPLPPGAGVAAGAGGAGDAIPPGAAADESLIEGVDAAAVSDRARAPAPAAGRHIEVYTGVASVTPGQPLPIHVSTTARTYSLSIARVTRDGPRTIYRARGLPGHDYRARITVDSATHMARAHWPVASLVPTRRFEPGVYIVSATTPGGSVGRTIAVVRTPVLSPSAPAFVFPALTYQAYSAWGGASLYSSPRGHAVSFDRPYHRGGLSVWRLGDDRLLPWLLAVVPRLQFTTDYDLSTSPPAAAPAFLILGRHTEYIGVRMRDWLDEHLLTRGDMGLVNLGANALYWQVRLGRTADGAIIVTCYKSRRIDPEVADRPAVATVRWREAPVGRPEGALLGAQYAGVVRDGHVGTASFTVTAVMPTDLIEGTGWRPGTVLHRLVQGETDALYPGASGVRVVMQGSTVDALGRRIAPAMTLRTTPAGARIFNAATFNLGAAISGSVSLGVPAVSLRHFLGNVIAWVADAPAHAGEADPRAAPYLAPGASRRA